MDFLRISFLATLLIPLRRNRIKPGIAIVIAVRRPPVRFSTGAFYKHQRVRYFCPQ
jgi:hypothetical protein